MRIIKLLLLLFFVTGSIFKLVAKEVKPAIIPWPKEIKINNSYGKITGTVKIILAANCSEKVKIGANILKSKLYKLGIAATIVDEKNTITGQTAIYIGTCGNNRLLKNKLKKYRIKVTPKNPGKQGYIIKSLKSNTRQIILIAGSDDMGTLYGCVTAEKLLVKRNNSGAILATTIKDWPDIKNRWLGSPRNQGCYGNMDRLFELSITKPASAEFKSIAKNHINRMKAYIDWLVSLKVNGMKLHTKPWGTMWPECFPQSIRTVIKEINDYAHARGVKVFYYDTTNLIPSKRAQKFFKNNWWKGIKLNNATGRNSRLCWSRDDLMRHRATKIGKFMADTAIDMVQLHGTDAGFYEDPEIWSQRCEKCRKRWGNNRTKASAHLYNTFITEIKKQYPKAEISLTLYPYSIDILSDKANYSKSYLPALENYWKHFEKYQPYKVAMLEYWHGMAKYIAPNIIFTTREAPIDAVEKFQKICSKHPLFIYYEMQSWLGWQTDFSSSFRYMKTFYNPSRVDDILWPSNEGKTLLTFIGAAEYSWNTNLPGAANWRPVSVNDGKLPKVIFEQALPRYCRNVWGDKISKLMTIALSQNIGWKYVQNPDKTFKEIASATFEDISLMNRQRTGSKIAVEALLKVFALVEADSKLLPQSRNMKYPVELLVKMSTLHQIAKAYCDYWKIKQQLRAKNYIQAKALKAKALVNLSNSPAVLKKLIAKIGAAQGPFRRHISEKSYWLAPALKKIAELKGKVAKIDCTKIVQTWPDFAKNRILNRIACAVESTQPPKIDGILDEAIWNYALPTDFFVLYKKGFKRPTHQTRFKILYDDKNLYIGFKAFTGKDKLIIHNTHGRDTNMWTGQDNIELFIAPSAKTKIFYQFVTTPNGTIFDSRGGSTAPPFRAAWNCTGLKVKTFVGNGYWSGEIVIPYEGIDSVMPQMGDGWKIMLARGIGKGHGKLETSAFYPVSNGFLNPSHYPPLVFIGTNVKKIAFTPDIVALDTTLSNKVLANQATSVVNFSFQIKTKTILHRATVTLKAVDAAGKTVGQSEPLTIGTLAFSWVPKYPVEIVLDREFNQIKVVVELQAIEGKVIKEFIINK